MTNTDKLSILVVDDRPENLSSMRHLLQQPGLEIITAGSGNEALALMLEADLALVLLDVQMPEMNGFEVAELMRRNERTRHVPIIFVTAINKERRQVFTGYEAGAVDYLFKPVDPFVIRSKVAVFLEMKRSQLARERLVRELNGAYNRLQELSDRKSDFLSAASHELRSPLTVIKEYCGLVHDGVVGEPNPDQKHCMHVALRNCNRLAGLVDNLLDLNAIETGHMICDRDELDLPELLETCREDFSETCAAAGQKLELEVVAGLPTVLADPAQVTQVLVNLLGNAHKFTPDGGTIRLSAHAEGEAVRIEVTDSGPGVPAEDQGRVFDKFVRLQGGEGSTPGSGLGLAIAQRLVDLQGGRIGVEDGTDGGARFHFTLPRHSEGARLRAFIRDGIGDENLRESRCLLLLQTSADLGLTLVEDQVRTILRRDADRLSRIRYQGVDTLAVVLTTHRDGALTFLARLESRLAADRRDAGPVTYALHEIEAGSGDTDSDLDTIGFVRLDLGMVARGGNDVPQPYSRG